MSASTAATASTATVAQELVALCRAGQNLEALKRLYSPNIVSVEPVGNEQMPAEMSGIDAIQAKNDWWINTFELHYAEANGPFVGEDQFAVHFTWEVTNKETGERKRDTEMALYTVKDGKIVREQFFYHTPGA